MKVLLHSTEPTDGQASLLYEKLNEYAASGTSLLIGRSTCMDIQTKHVLTEAGCQNVTVYSTEAMNALPLASWSTCIVEQSGTGRRLRHHGCFMFGKEAIWEMSGEADQALVLWSEEDLDAFATALCLVALDKAIEVVKPDGTLLKVGSIEDLRSLLPPRNPKHAPASKNIRMQDQWAVAERFIPSKSVANRPGMHPFWKWEIVDIILGSPTSLDAKLEALENLSGYDDLMHELLDEAEERLADTNKNKGVEDRLQSIAFGCNHVTHGSFSFHAAAIRKALEALQHTGDGEIVYRKSFWDERPELFEEHEAGVAPFASFDAALQDLRFEMELEEWDEDAPCWTVFEKWRLAPDGAWEKPYSYYAIMDEVVFFEKNRYDDEEHCWRAADSTYCGSTAPDLNIRTPFDVGDVIILDCRPFAPLRHALVLEAEYQGKTDCCMPRVLHLDDYESARKGTPMWTEAGPKHASSLNLCMPGFSPLYRMELYDGPLPEGEKLLGDVQQWLQGDAEKGKQLCEALACEMNTEEILAFISEHRYE